MKTSFLTAVAMIAFAANSVLARLAFATAGAEPLSYTGIRLASGAVVLVALLGLRQRGVPQSLAGSWAAAAALFGYAFAFSIAYVLLGAGTGALILFASVQIGIVGWAILKGDRPGALEWLGLVVALAAFAWLVSPGLVAPHPVGAGLMVGAGLCWAAYTLLGRGSSSPLADTAGNFARTLPAALILLLVSLFGAPLDPIAAGYAVASGALASGLGYAVWYLVLPGLPRTTAAVVQLTVPALAAVGGVVLIGEQPTLRLVVASLGIIGGVAMALIGADRRRRTGAG
ncbi:MAG: DMT family transporter [Devosia sp.]|uniref:DMT family transporter n=1 Tax=Devosia sp. TaxID=1871048 RepID=UPI001AC7772D|nr:DMT family transporter [Devosia sp.]MBN9316454.1 DMT family transporter [Devosia sp.]